MTVEERLKIVPKVQNALAQIRPYLQQDGGDVEFVEMDAAGVVFVRLQGHCGSCPHALMILEQGIEAALKEAIPEVTAVERVID